MTAYGLSERWSRSKKCYKLLDPTSYTTIPGKSFKQNKAPFLSSSKRKTLELTIYTEQLYDTDTMRPKIPTCTSLMSKTPRFPYEAFSKEDLEAVLCRCGISNTCDCPPEENTKEENTCAAKTYNRLFIGHPPGSILGAGISVPSRGHRGFELLPDGSVRKIPTAPLTCNPPFYDTRVNEATAFYHGWKWSNWKGKRCQKPAVDTPGPADYISEKKPTEFEICLEKLRESRRLTSKQYKNELEKRPGPADYFPHPPQHTKMKMSGTKAERFSSAKYEIRPCPMDYDIKRAFDPPDVKCICYAKFSKPGLFGTAPRFQNIKIVGPSPADYTTNKKICNFMHCLPFGSSAPRFKDTNILNKDDDDDDSVTTEEDSESKNCPPGTYQFKSVVARMHPLKKNLNSASPADYAPIRRAPRRSRQIQYNAPFNSSEGRFRPWPDWLPAYGQVKTPGICYYAPEKYRCRPAVHRGPLFRSPRFRRDRFLTPAPNAYTVIGAMETSLKTHNSKLIKNLESRHKYHWEPKNEPMHLTPEEKEKLLLDRMIEERESTSETTSKLTDFYTDKTKSSEDLQRSSNNKLLRTFLFKRPMPYY